MSERKRVAFDPAVLAAVTDGDRRQKDRSLTLSQRKKARQDEARVKATYDLPEWLIQAISDLADGEHCSRSSVAAFLLAKGLEAYRREEFTFEGHYVPSRSPRYEFILDVPRSEENP